jgi:hypothetical protein
MSDDESFRYENAFFEERIALVALEPEIALWRLPRGSTAAA